jgi:D-alanyl-D-alanine carboxypeptidase
MATESQGGEGWSHLALHTVVVIIVAFASAGIASQAAFQKVSPKPLDESEEFWQNTSSETITAKTKSGSDATSTDNNISESVPVKTDASGYIVADLKSGQVLAAKNANRSYPVASLTKLMTAVVARETISNDTKITITDEAAASYGNTGRLSAGQEISLSTLYYPLLLSSSNDAAAAIAGHIGQANFRNLMNRKALAIGMNQTQFGDATGLSASNTASAADISRLAQYIYTYHDFIFDITTWAQQTTSANTPGPDQYINTHPLHTEPGFSGGKNGYTDEAQQTLLSVFTTEKNGSTRPVIIAVLGSNEAASDTQKLLSWATKD